MAQARRTGLLSLGGAQSSAVGCPIGGVEATIAVAHHACAGIGISRRIGTTARLCRIDINAVHISGRREFAFNGGQNQHDARTALALPAVLRHPEPMPQVLNIRHLPGFKERQPIIPPGAVYIGRRNARYRLPVSKWGNPFSIKREADRAEAIAAYERWLQSQRPLMEALHELSGLDLVCWCAPLPCHGDVLLRLANE